MVTLCIHQGSRLCNGILVPFFLVLASLAWAQTDTLRLKDGNNIIGKIKGMDKGVVTIATSYGDNDFRIKWAEVVAVSSDRWFEIVLVDGTRFKSDVLVGVLVSGLAFDNDEGKRQVAFNDIVYLRSGKGGFLSRLTGSVSFGLNLTKSNSLRQLTARSNIEYTLMAWAFNATYNSVTSHQDDAEKTNRTNANIGVNYRLKDDWFLEFKSDLLSNDEQKLRIRATNRLGAGNYGVGNYIIHTHHMGLGGGLGVAWNVERYTDAENTDRNSLEAYAGFEASFFGIGGLGLYSSVIAYPSITENKRFRTDFDLDIKYNLPLDLFIKLGLSYNFDNQPVEGASRDDYVLQATFGWRF